MNDWLIKNLGMEIGEMLVTQELENAQNNKRI